MQLNVPATGFVAEGRTAEILGRVRKAFVEKGFDGASMQDLARSAGISVGNFYRYFSSKEAIIEAMVTLDMQDIDRQFAMILQSGEPMQALRLVIAERMSNRNCDDDGALWAEIEAAARRKPRIAMVSGGIEQAIVDKLVMVFQLVTGPVDDEKLRWLQTEARMLVLLVKAGAMRAAMGADTDLELKSRIERIIDDILNSICKGC